MDALAVDGVTKAMGYDHKGARVFEVRDGATRRFFGGHAETENGLIYKYYSLGDRLIATRTAAAAGLSEVPPGAANLIVLPPEAYWVLMTVVTLLLVVPIGKTRVTIGYRVAQSRALGGALLVLTITLPLVVSPGCSGNGNIRHYHLDPLGNPLAVTENGWGLGAQYRYSAYGEVRRYDQFGVPLAVDPENRREFTGYQTDAESELQYAGARFYDPSQAQFLSLDPAGQFASPYSYVGWNPINRIDPNGAIAYETAALIASLVALAISVTSVTAQAIKVAIEVGPGAGAKAYYGGHGSLLAGTIVGLGLGHAGQAGAYIAAGLAVGSVAYGAYGVARGSNGAFNAVIAGVGLATAIVGAAFAFASAGRPSQGAQKATAKPKQSGTLDARSESNLQGLHPDAEAAARQHINQLKAEGIDARVTGGNRTYAEQDALYKIGRRGIPGEATVTNAKGGQSYHNFEVAYDISIFDSSGTYITNGSDASYVRAAVVGQSLGLDAGISFGDASHFALTRGVSISKMNARFRGGLDVYTGK